MPAVAGCSPLYRTTDSRIGWRSSTGTCAALAATRRPAVRRGLAGCSQNGRTELRHGLGERSELRVDQLCELPQIGRPVADRPADNALDVVDERSARREPVECVVTLEDGIVGGE